MTRTSQLAAHYAVLQLDALFDNAVTHFRTTAELLIEEFWEHYPQCDRDARRLDAVGKTAHAELVDLLRKMRGDVVRTARRFLTARQRCGKDKDDLPQLDKAVLAEFRRLTDAYAADEKQRWADEEREEQRRAAKTEEDAFDDAFERHAEGLFDYANGEGPGPWFSAAREGGAL